MKNLKRNLKIFSLFARFTMKSTFENKVGAVLFTIGKILRFLLFLLFVYFLFSKTKILKGYDLNQAILFYLTFNVIDTASQVLFREVYRFKGVVRSGEFDAVLIKPYHPFMKVLLGGVDFLDLVLLPLYLLLALYFAFQVGVELQGLLLYFILLFNAVLISAAFHIGVLAFGLLTSEVDNAIWIYRDLTTLGRFPFEIYTKSISWFFTFIIPVGIMMSFPPKALFGLLSPQMILYSCFFAIFVFYGSVKIWNLSIKHYQSWGG